MIKSRSASPGPAPAPPQSIDDVRRRARHRLIGASVLVLVGVVGFSLLFDTQPRPLAVDIPIEIPARSVPGQAASAPVPAPAPQGSAELASAPESSAPASTPSAPPEPASPPEPPQPAPAPPAPPPPAADAPATPPPVLAPAPATQADRAEPLPAASADDDKPLRLVVQVGAFAESARAQEVRRTIERAGLKTYTHVAETAEGRRIRVRLGPFSSRAEAERAAARVKALGFPAAILTL